MFVFQATGEEKIGVMVGMKPNEFTPNGIPDKLEVVTFNKNSEQGQQIIASQATAEAAKAEVVNKINAMPPNEKEKANASLREFDKAMGAYEIGMMNGVVTQGAMTLPPETMDKMITAAINLSNALGYGGERADPVDGKNMVGKLEDATKAAVDAKFVACESVTRMVHEKGYQIDAKMAEMRKAGSTHGEYEVLPKAKTGEASGPLRDISYKVGGVLNNDQLKAIEANSKKVTQQAITENKRPVASPQ